MTGMKRFITGLAFTATIAVALLSSGGDAYAKSKSGGGNLYSASGGTITITLDPGAETVYDVGGITWE